MKERQVQSGEGTPKVLSGEEMPKSSLVKKSDDDEDDESGGDDYDDGGGGDDDAGDENEDDEIYRVESREKTSGGSLSII